MPSLPSRKRGLLVLLGAALLLPGAAAAQAGDGFLFRRPVASLSLHGGFAHASAGSDIFAFTTEHLTVGRGDFSAPSLGADLAIRLSPRVDLAVGGSYAGRASASEFRDWEDEDDLPIEQTTRFDRLPLTASARLYLAPRGRTVGSFAWVPNRYAPYVGAGGGAMWYRFRQTGDFVDFQTLDIFRDELESSGWTPTAQGLAGVDLSLTPRLVLKGEARYTWARAKLDNAFEHFDPIDLSGLSATVGLSVRF